jgi:hypothetical protein
MQLGMTERIVDRKNRAAGITKNVADAQALERFAEDLCTC